MPDTGIILLSSDNFGEDGPIRAAKRTPERLREASLQNRRRRWLARFIDRQKHSLEWAPLTEIAGRYGRQVGEYEGYAALIKSLLSGSFEQGMQCKCPTHNDYV